MKPFYLLFFLFVVAGHVPAQEVAKAKLSYQLSIDFQGFDLPLSKLKNYSNNPGFSVGLLYDWNQKKSLQQILRLGALSNRYHGNTWYAYSALQRNFFPSKAISLAPNIGLGYMIAGTGISAYQQNADGLWGKTSAGKGLMFATVGASLSVTAVTTQRLTLQPFIAYQLPVMIGYNPQLPVLPFSLISIGSTIKI